MQIRDLRYNDRITAFEASVSVIRDGIRLRFPCRVFGPASLSPAIVQNNLYRQATKMADAR